MNIGNSGIPVWSGELAETPIGPINVTVSEVGLRQVAFAPLSTWAPQPGEQPQAPETAPAWLGQALEQMGDYLQCHCRLFGLPIDWRGVGNFQREVLELTQRIAFGEVRTYADLAHDLGRPRAARAVGGALARNPMPLVLPCHRVVGSDRRLHGFGAPGGITTKAWLLQLEGVRIVDQRLG